MTRTSIPSTPLTGPPSGHRIARVPERRRPSDRIHVPPPFGNPLAPAASVPTLLPVIDANDELLPSVERLMDPIARRAQEGDLAARDALYVAFEPKLLRFVRRIRVPYAPGGACGVWDRDDVAQEAYLVFLGIIHSWTPGIPFGRYVLANFPWRLRDTVHRGIGRRRIPPRTTTVPAERLDWLADDSWHAAEAEALIESIAATLEPPLDQVLRLHVLEGESITATALRLGVSRRSASRYWGRILDQLRPGLISVAGDHAHEW